MNDPYKTLGVDRTATDDEVKKAYRDLARKYHPDNYVNSPLIDLVQEKMKEINEAYDQIQKERASGSRSSASTSASGAWGDYSSIREYILSERFAEAEIILDAISESNRNAEWNYLKGFLLVKRGWFYDAQKYAETACYMDPSNEEYSAFLKELKKRTEYFGNSYRRSRGVTNDSSVCSLCTGLICADCLCECCGHDLIACC